MSVLERKIQHSIRLALGAEPDLALFRNQVGKAKERDEETGKLRVIPYGLMRGSADLVGILRMPAVRIPLAPTLEFRADLGRWFSLEVKSETGRATPEQVLWAELVRKFGGFAAFVRSVEEAKHALDRARKGASE